MPNTNSLKPILPNKFKAKSTNLCQSAPECHKLMNCINKMLETYRHTKPSIINGPKKIKHLSFLMVEQQISIQRNLELLIKI